MVLPETTIKIVQACVALHNMLQCDDATVLRDGYNLDSVDGFGNLESSEVGVDEGTGSDIALAHRLQFSQYVDKFPLSWQDAHVQRGYS